MFINVIISDLMESESMLIVTNLIPYLRGLSKSFPTASLIFTSAKFLYQQSRSQGFSFEGKAVGARFVLSSDMRKNEG